MSAKLWDVLKIQAFLSVRNFVCFTDVSSSQVAKKVGWMDGWITLYCRCTEQIVQENWVTVLIGAGGIQE